MTLKATVKKILSQMHDLKEEADHARGLLEEDRDKWNDKSEKYQESDKGQEVDEMLNAVETLLDDIENIDLDFEI